jgi:hypothetical protein
LEIRADMVNRSTPLLFNSRPIDVKRKARLRIKQLNPEGILLWTL